METIHEKFEDSTVLDVSQAQPSPKASPEQLAQASKPSLHQQIDVMAIEAETLLLSMQATHRLLKEDTQSFIDIRLDQRIAIFTQMTKIFHEAIKDDVNNKTEILTMNGVEIMSDIVSFILAQAVERTSKVKSLIDGKLQVPTGDRAH